MGLSRALFSLVFLSFALHCVLSSGLFQPLYYNVAWMERLYGQPDSDGLLWALDSLALAATKAYIEPKWKNEAAQIADIYLMSEVGQRCPEHRSKNLQCRGNYDGALESLFIKCYEEHMHRREFIYAPWHACQLERSIVKHQLLGFAHTSETCADVDTFMNAVCCHDWPPIDLRIVYDIQPSKPLPPPPAIKSRGGALSLKTARM